MTVPPPPSGSWDPGGRPGPLTAEDRNWAMAAHVGSIVTAWFALGLIAPLVVLLLRGDASPFVRRHAVESLNFQINAFVLTIVFALLMFVLVGFILLPVYGVFYLVCVVIATVRASNGEEYRYPLTVRLVS
ncbi:DUF4870 domain-containing protein [Pseudonocardia benzenivorans]|uniref:DUF4870 domain-containing protein n=1 Tax=Pseudonocardia benzenivorans TaxID=228005 RepID=A0ABW3VRA7_9PSEU